MMRVFNGASFETSSVRGESGPITVKVGGGINWPANLVGLQGFSLAGPSPIAGKLSVERPANGLTLIYTGTLQSADAVTGPYADVAGVASPTTITFSSAAKFYRLKP